MSSGVQKKIGMPALTVSWIEFSFEVMLAPIDRDPLGSLMKKKWSSPTCKQPVVHINLWSKVSHTPIPGVTGAHYRRTKTHTAAAHVRASRWLTDCRELPTLLPPASQLPARIGWLGSLDSLRGDRARCKRHTRLASRRNALEKTTYRLSLLDRYYTVLAYLLKTNQRVLGWKDNFLFFTSECIARVMTRRFISNRALGNKV